MVYENIQKNEVDLGLKCDIFSSQVTDSGKGGAQPSGVALFFSIPLSASLSLIHSSFTEGWRSPFVLPLMLKMNCVRCELCVGEQYR